MQAGNWRALDDSEKKRMLERIRSRNAARREEIAAGERQAVAAALPIPFCPHVPHRAQARFLAVTAREALYGGAAGGGKSDALLMAALQHVDQPGYSALLLRRSFSDLTLAGALLDRARYWLAGTGARWVERERTWRFPSGACLAFGYVDSVADAYHYQSAEYQFIGFDELTQIEERAYLFLFSRLRRPAGSKLPLRVRSATNPGGRGHEWVLARWDLAKWEHSGRPAGWESRGRAYVPARKEDNPSLDTAEYEQSLAELDPVTRAQQEHGDWTVRPSVGFLKREWFRSSPAAPSGLHWVRFWDTAQSAKQRSSWWAGAKCSLRETPAGRELWIADVTRGRWEYAAGRSAILAAARADGSDVSVGIEARSSGADLLSDLRGSAEGAGYFWQSVTPAQDKPTRAGPWASMAEAGRVWLVSGSWVADFLAECDAFPGGGPADDQVDAVSGAYALLVKGSGWYDEGDEVRPGESADPWDPDDGGGGWGGMP